MSSAARAAQLEIPPVPADQGVLGQISAVQRQLRFRMETGMAAAPDNATPEHRMRCDEHRAWLGEVVLWLSDMHHWLEETTGQGPPR